ncbi:MAG: long-chain fatty acid--CoA ligase [Betaproteobacteria bacterium]|nr:long-chain fatty acid--CoA ligase [Betaproteobacteria bacterium]
MNSTQGRVDNIPQEVAVTLDGLFRERVARTPDNVAYREFDEHQGKWVDYTWREMDRHVARWQAAMRRDGLKPGERVAVMLKNCPAWVMLDQAALGMGMVVVPLYTSDRPDNVAYVINDSGAKLLLIEGEDQWLALSAVRQELTGLTRILTLQMVEDSINEPRLRTVGEWLPDEAAEVEHVTSDPKLLATIVYTSGTTGRPKGVMLSHNNIISNAAACLKTMAVRTDDMLLSFLPLSHTFERTVGYYLTIMSGSTVSYCRGIPVLADDLQIVRPTILITVPRIFERVYAGIRAKLAEAPPARRKLFDLAVEVGYARFEYLQGRGPWKPAFLLWPVLNRLVASKVLARLGGRLRATICGGAALAPDVSRVFIGLGLNVLQGYGLTETSPVATTNRVNDNLPASVGTTLPGVEVKIGERNALLVKGPNIMLGYWNNPEATRAMFTEDGWLNTGDTVRIDEKGHIFITGRLKEIIVMSNGEKVPPVDLEAAILRDSLFEQVMLLGEGKPYLSVLAVLNAERWKAIAKDYGLDADAHQVLGSQQAEQMVLERITHHLREFPGYAQVRRAALFLDPWTVENGFLTPTMKLKRSRVIEHYRSQVNSLYEGH